jgi:Cytochrome c554 and c-prime
VNDANKVAFADRKPKAPAKGDAGYVGVEACTNCHDDARKVWDGTSHARAYATLEKGFKEFNLDCVSCHVTGYDKPGGSTVTFVDKLKDVQCEECHGPGSLHARKPDKKGLITLKPDPQSCVSQCHHPPHVENFDPVAKMELILGPGHGKD